jgi:Ca2+-binding EF-hand superfamily protein
MKEKRFGKLLISILIALAMGGVAIFSWASEDNAKKAVSRFILDFDQSGDGLVSAEEFPGSQDRFDEMDADGNGYVDETEAPHGPPPMPLDPETILADWDKDGDGQISSTEFLGPPDHFDDLDADADGVLTAEELAAGMSTPPMGQPMGNRFENDDTDGDGLVSQAEFQGPQELFDEMDADGDGYISRSEAQPAHPANRSPHMN